MLHLTKGPNNRNQIEKSLKRAVKRVLAAKGINLSTRKGNKELDFVLKQMTGTSFSSFTEVEATGEALGIKIVELSEQLGKTHLDRGVIRHLSLQKYVASVIQSRQEISGPAAQAEIQPGRTKPPHRRWLSL